MDRALDKVETINPFRPAEEFYLDEGCHIVELHNTDTDAACSIARARVAPGVTTGLHCLRDIVERYVIVTGRGAVEIDGQAPVAVAAMDVVTIPAGVSQRIHNVGDSDLVFLCICTPRFDTENYIQLMQEG
jgi:mannose-6-phosphate isomerase-like protein (cupin superfamily)